MGPDIYSLAMYGFYKDNNDKKDLEDLGPDHICTSEDSDMLEHQQALKLKQDYRNHRNEQNYLKVAMIFSLQLILLTCLLYFIIITPFMNGKNGRFIDDDELAEAFVNQATKQTHYLEGYLLFLVKPICCILLHITMQPKVKEGLIRLIHIMLHPDDFDQILIPIVVCVMKCIVEIYLEVMCIALVSKSTNIDETIMDFIALSVISNLDEKYFESINDPLKDKLIEEKYKIPITVKRKRELFAKEKSVINEEDAIDNCDNNDDFGDHDH